LKVKCLSTGSQISLLHNIRASQSFSYLTTDPCKEWKEFEANGRKLYAEFVTFAASNDRDQASIDKWKKTAEEFLKNLPKYKDLKKADGTLCIDAKTYEHHLKGAQQWVDAAGKVKPTQE
jgi:hypothetical protein